MKEARRFKLIILNIEGKCSDRGALAMVPKQMVKKYGRRGATSRKGMPILKKKRV